MDKKKPDVILPENTDKPGRTTRIDTKHLPKESSESEPSPGQDFAMSESNPIPLLAQEDNQMPKKAKTKSTEKEESRTKKPRGSRKERLAAKK